MKMELCELQISIAPLMIVHMCWQSYLSVYINRFPGHDYRQPAPAVFKPARAIDFEREAHDSDEEEIEVQVATPGESSLPVAVTEIVEDDDDAQPYEVEAVVDFTIPVGMTTVRAINLNNDDDDSAANDVQQAQVQSDIVCADDMEQMSQASDNWAEDRNHELSTEEHKVCFFLFLFLFYYCVQY